SAASVCVDFVRMRAQTLDEQSLLGFLGSCFRNLWHDLQITWREVRLQTGAAAGEHGLDVEARVIHGLHGGDHILLARRPGAHRHAVHENVVDLRILGDHPLHEAGVDEIAVATDAAARAVIEEEPTVCVTMAHVAAAVPAVPDLAPGGLRIAEVFDARFPAFGPAADLADYAWRAPLALGGRDRHDGPWHGLAERAHRTFARTLESHAAAVAGAIDLEDLYAETTLERLPDRRRHAAADDHTHGIVGIVRPHRLTEDRRRHAAEHRERGRAVATA